MSSILRFPSDFEETNGNWLVFTEYDYSRPNRSASATVNATGNVISLPVPINMESNHVADWENASLGAWNQFLNDHSGDIANVTKKALSNYSATGSPDLINTIMNGINVPKAMGDAAKAIGTDIGTNNQIFRNIGATVALAKNPFQAVMFNQVGLRTFNFQYKLIPKSWEEAEQIKSIITSFKKAMHPSLGVDALNNLMRYPSMFGIEFADPEIAKMMFKFGMCVLTEVGVNYHGEGSAIYLNENGKRAPASIMLSLTFREIEMNTRESIEAGR